VRGWGGVGGVGGGGGGGGGGGAGAEESCLSLSLSLNPMFSLSLTRMYDHDTKHI